MYQSDPSKSLNKFGRDNVRKHFLDHPQLLYSHCVIQFRFRTKVGIWVAKKLNIEYVKKKGCSKNVSELLFKSWVDVLKISIIFFSFRVYFLTIWKNNNRKNRAEETFL